MKYAGLAKCSPLWPSPTGPVVRQSVQTPRLVRPDTPYTVHSPSRMLDCPSHSRLVRLYSPQPILPFRVVVLRVALAGLKKAIDLAALVNEVSVIGGASDRSDSSSLMTMVGWLLKNDTGGLAFLEFSSACY